MNNQDVAIVETSLSERFLQHIKAKVPNGRLAEALMQILSIEKSSAYRRTSGASPLSLEEMALLARHFKLSIDQFIFADTNKSVFTFPYMEQPVQSIGNFMEGIAQRIEQAAQLEEMKIDFVSREIPIFHYFNFPELTAFKAYIWGRTVWKLPQFQKQKFSLRKIKGIKRYQQKILKHYNILPGNEIWGTDGLSIPLSQIEYYLEQDMFEEPEEALLLCEQLRALMQHVAAMTKQGKKFALGTTPTSDAPDFQLYHNQLAHTNSFILVTSPQVKVSFVTMDNLHPATITDPSFHAFMDNWRARLTEQSVAISGVSSGTHTKFFNQAKKQISRFERSINRILEGRADI
jgi:hypothetical protein